MTFLAAAGFGTVPVAFDSASKNPPELLGFGGRVYAGNYRVSYRVQKRSWKFRTDWLLDATAASLETLLALGAVIAWSGDFLGGSVNCIAMIGEGPILNADGGDGKGFMRSLNILLIEQ